MLHLQNLRIKLPKVQVYLDEFEHIPIQIQELQIQKDVNLMQ